MNTYYYVGPYWAVDPTPVSEAYRVRLFENGEHLVYGRDDPAINDGWVPAHATCDVCDCTHLPDGDYTFVLEYHIGDEVYTTNELTITLDRGCE